MQEGLCESGKVVCDVVVHGLQASMTELDRRLQQRWKAGAPMP
jgi:hypothetical protein